MDMTEALNAQLAILLFLSLVPMPGTIQARCAQRSKIRVFEPENEKLYGQRSCVDHFGR